ncbi:DUF2256 domain-containing protein [Acidipila rosea]|uniref:DUF2256 domain-containing protein n=1 Tax=Acidipila rosea TaxID=768535 RepID=UPI001FB540E8|nr:DUF2256 domain-containing protein [Acidipila rosea]
MRFCGRTIEWRKRWARDWEQVRYCSDACRSVKVKPSDGELESARFLNFSGSAAQRRQSAPRRRRGAWPPTTGSR